MYARQFVDLTGETLTNVSLLEDHLNNLLFDLITLAMNKYSKVCVYLCVRWCVVYGFVEQVTTTEVLLLFLLSELRLAQTVNP